MSFVYLQEPFSIRILACFTDLFNMHVAKAEN